MKVTKAQAQENRAHIVATASALFRERGYDGVGIAELMAAAGFTHGGFYKHFRSKADLMAEAAATTISRAVADSAGSEQKSTRLNSSHVAISYAVFCLKKKKRIQTAQRVDDVG